VRVVRGCGPHLSLGVGRHKSEADMFVGLLEASKALLSAASTLSKLGDDRRTKLATHFDAIAKVLTSILERKSKGEKSVDLCTEVQVYADKIRELSRSTVSEADLERLSAALEQAQYSRAMMYYVNSPTADYYEAYIDQLNETAGLLRGLANTLRAK